MPSLFMVLTPSLLIIVEGPPFYSSTNLDCAQLALVTDRKQVLGRTFVYTTGMFEIFKGLLYIFVEY